MDFMNKDTEKYTQAALAFTSLATTNSDNAGQEHIATKQWINSYPFQGYSPAAVEIVKTAFQPDFGSNDVEKCVSAGDVILAGVEATIYLYSELKPSLTPTPECAQLVKKALENFSHDAKDQLESKVGK